MRTWLTVALVGLLAGCDSAPLTDEEIEANKQRIMREVQKEPEIDEEECKRAVKSHCTFVCIENTDSPADQPYCETHCRKRDLSYWKDEIPECTPGL